MPIPQETPYGRAKIDKMILTSCIGEDLDITNFFASMHIFEDIFNPVLTGYIMIADASNIIDNLPIVGEETLTLSFRSYGYNVEKDPFGVIHREFSVVRVRDLTFESDFAKRYIIDIVSKEGFKSKQIQVSRAWQNKTESEVVLSLMEENFEMSSDVLGLGMEISDYSGPLRQNVLDSEALTIEKHGQVDDEKNKVEILLEETGIEYPWITVGYDHPFNHIKTMQRRAVHKDQMEATNFFFFENKRGFNLLSLRTLLMQPKDNLNTIRFGAMTKYAENEKDAAESTPAFGVRIDTAFDIFNMMKTGVYGSKLFSYYLDSGNGVERVFDHLKDFDDKATTNYNSDLENYPPFYLDESNKNSRTERHGARHTFAAINYGMTDPITGLKTRAVASDRAAHLTEENTLQKIAEFETLNSFKFIVDCDGDSRHKVGDLVKFELNTYNTETEKFETNKYYYGYYLITSIQHVISADGAYRMHMEIMKDSVATKIGK